MSVEHNVCSHAAAIDIRSSLPTDSRDGRQADDRNCALIENSVFDLHQFNGTAEALGNLRLECSTTKLHMMTGGCPYICEYSLARALTRSDRLIADKIGEAARTEPGKVAVVVQSSEGESPIAGNTVPAQMR